MLIDMFAGFAGGIAAVVVGHPLDVVKVKMQLNPNKYSGMFDCLQKTVKEQHFRGLYTGMVSALISYCTENTILFGVYGRCQQEIASLTGCETKDLSWKKNAMVGGVSSVSNVHGAVRLLSFGQASLTSRVPLNPYFCNCLLF
jgi:solute carrier family 25 carnitine/acylcarnitine transporter 20/29